MKLSVKIALYFTALVLLFGIIASLLVGRLLNNRLTEHQNQWASALTRAISESITKDTLNHNVLHARETLQGVVEREASIDYAYIVDFEGQVFSHSFSAGFPRFLLEMEGSKHEVRRQLVYSTTNGEILELSEPLIGGLDAHLHIGLNQNEINKIIEKTRWSIAYTMVALIILGVFLAWLLSRRISKPMERLAIQMRAYGQGERTPTGSSVGASDREVAELATSFRQMIDERSKIEAARAQAESELKKHRDHLEELVAERTAALDVSNKELEAFSYTVAHDLRAPLRSITSFSQILLEDARAKLDAGEMDSLHRIIKAGRFMGDLIDDILQLARISRGEIRREAIDLSEICRLVTEQLSDVEPTRRVEWTIENGLTAHGDPKLVRIVLENLLGNAWKFTKAIQTPRIEFGELEDAQPGVYYIKDNGAGFDMRHQSKLFGVFQRLHGADEFEGTGVGLASVQRVIHRHGGEIWAEGAVGSGATFYFTLSPLHGSLEKARSNVA